MNEYKILIKASGAHAHLSDADVEALFGEGEVLNNVRFLGDGKSGQYLSDKKVEIVTEKGRRTLSVLGPTRKESQIELSYTEARPLGLRPPVSDSGKLEGTLGCKLVGPKGEIELEKGVMVARRHIHLNEGEAEKAGFADGDYVKVRIEGERALVFDNVLVRYGKGGTVMHVDFDEMNAAGLLGDSYGYAFKD